MKRYKITLPDELAEQVEQEARRAGVPVATWIRMLVIERIAPYPVGAMDVGIPVDVERAEAIRNSLQIEGRIPITVTGELGETPFSIDGEDPPANLAGEPLLDGNGED